MPPDSFATKYFMKVKSDVGLVLPHFSKSFKLFVIFVVWGILGPGHTKRWLSVCSASINIQTFWLKLMVEFSRQQAAKGARLVRCFGGGGRWGRGLKAGRLPQGRTIPPSAPDLACMHGS